VLVEAGGGECLRARRLLQVLHDGAGGVVHRFHHVRDHVHHLGPLLLGHLQLQLQLLGDAAEAVQVLAHLLQRLLGLSVGEIVGQVVMQRMLRVDGQAGGLRRGLRERAAAGRVARLIGTGLGAGRGAGRDVGGGYFTDGVAQRSLRGGLRLQFVPRLQQRVVLRRDRSHQDVEHQLGDVRGGQIFAEAFPDGSLERGLVVSGAVRFDLRFPADPLPHRGL